MSRRWLLLDCNYLCHRAKHTTGELNYEGNATGVMYGFLKYLSTLQSEFSTTRFVFCWDSKTNKRKEIFPEYKAHRIQKEQNWSDEEIEFDRAFRKQMKKLRTTYLSMIGFKNVFIQKGYESDDVIASICLNLPVAEAAVIVSSDSDLYQLIRHNITLYNPHTSKILTLQGFKKKYGVLPKDWAMLKAIAGCSSDNIKGVKGIGEITALKYLRGELTEGKKYTEIVCSIAFNRYFPLVKLPFKGTHKFKLRRDKLSKQGWKQVTKLLGMRSIKDRMPFGRRECMTRKKLL